MIWIIAIVFVGGCLVYFLFFDRPMSPEERERALRRLERSIDARNRLRQNEEWEDSGFTREEIEYDYLQRQQEKQDEEDEYLSRMNED